MKPLLLPCWPMQQELGKTNIIISSMVKVTLLLSIKKEIYGIISDTIHNSKILNNIQI